jgi:Cdc6-like AAA superfamily ATPase
MYEGRGQLIDRLTWQVGGDRKMALKILRHRGHMFENSEELTQAGQARNMMTAAERARDRDARQT